MVDFSTALLLQVVVNGLIAGGIYALVAVGYTVIYGILRFINFAHGEIVATGAFMAAFFLSIGWNLPEAALASILVTASIGFLTERIVYRPLRNAPKLSLLVAAIALSIILQALLLIVFGANPHALPQPPAHEIAVAGATVTDVQLLIIAASVICVIAVELFLSRTKTGREIRAAADNPDLAKAIGIPTDRVIAIGFVLASALAAIAGILSGLDHSFDYLMGVQIGLKAFAAAVIGGIGSVPGAFLGGYLLGMAENLGLLFIPSSLRDGIAFALLIAFLLWKPTGLISSQERKA